MRQGCTRCPIPVAGPRWGGLCAHCRLADVERAATWVELAAPGQWYVFAPPAPGGTEPRFLCVGNKWGREIFLAATTREGAEKLRMAAPSWLEGAK